MRMTPQRPPLCSDTSDTGVARCQKENAGNRPAPELRAEMSSREILYYRKELAQRESLQIDLPACVVDIDTHQISVRIAVEHNTFGNLAALGTRLFGKTDIKRIGQLRLPDSRTRNAGHAI